MKCPVCGTELKLETSDEIHHINGKEVSISYRILYCPKCGKRYLDYWSLHEAIEKAWEETQNDIDGI